LPLSISLFSLSSLFAVEIIHASFCSLISPFLEKKEAKNHKSGYSHID